MLFAPVNTSVSVDEVSIAITKCNNNGHPNNTNKIIYK